MSDSLLYQMIRQIEHGTHLHIGVLFFKFYGNAQCDLPRIHGIHQSPTCDLFKSKSHRSFMRCYRCRFLAIRKALYGRKPFGGLCINGVYEYTHPVIIGGDVAAVIFIGNILENEKGRAKLLASADTPPPLETMEAQISPEDCPRIAETLDHYIRYLLEKFPDASVDEKPLITNIKRYVDDMPAFSITINELADVFHYNPRYLGRLFKKETGVSLNDYILARRLKRAAALLRNTGHSVLEISSETGFNNVTYFNKQFKAAFGTTPTAYRKQAKKPQ